MKYLYKSVLAVCLTLLGFLSAGAYTCPDALYLQPNLLKSGDSDFIAMTKDGNTFSVKGVTLEAAGSSQNAQIEFTQISGSKFYTGITYGGATSPANVTVGTPIAFMEDQGGSWPLYIAPGDYDITIDFDTTQVLVTAAGAEPEPEPEPELGPEHLYLAPTSTPTADMPEFTTSDRNTYTMSGLVIKSTSDWTLTSLVMLCDGTGTAWSDVPTIYGPAKMTAVENGQAYDFKDYPGSNYWGSASQFKVMAGTYDVTVDWGAKSVTFTETAPAALYLVGNANNWDFTAPTEMTKSGSTFTLADVQMPAASDTDAFSYFSFLTGAGADAAAARLFAYYAPQENGTEVLAGTPAALKKDPGSDKAFKVAAGTYTVAVDLEAMTVTLTATAAPEPPAVEMPEALYLLSNPSKLASAVPMTKDGDTFKLDNVEFAANFGGKANLSFPVQMPTSDTDYDALAYGYGAAESGQTLAAGVATAFVKGDQYGAYDFDLAPGTYNVVADFATMQVTLTSVATPEPEPEVTVPDNLYLIGTVSSWEAGEKKPLVKDGNTYKLENVVLPAAADNAEASYFQFCTVLATDWNAINASDRYGAASQNAPVAAGTPAQMVAYPANVSASGCLSWSAAPGTYDIVADFQAMTVTLTAVETPEPPTPPTADVPEALYIIGNVNSWTTSTALPMTKDGNVFTLSGLEMPAADNDTYSFFSFLTEQAADWEAVKANPRYGAESDGTVVADNASATLVKYEPGVEAPAFKAEAGKYDVTVDFDAMTVSLVLIPAPEPVAVPEHLYLYGEYNDNNCATMVELTKNGNVFTGSSVDMTQGYQGQSAFMFASALGENKFDTSAIEEHPVYVPAVNETEIVLGTPAAMIEYNGRTANEWLVATGTYDITVDFDAMTVTFTEPGDTPEPPTPPTPETDMPEALYIIGNCNGWNTATALPMTKNEETKTFTIDDLEMPAADGAELSYFSFITALGDSWDAVNASDRYGATEKDAPISLSAPAAFQLFAKDVDASAANSWAINPGNYKVEVNFADKTVSVNYSTSLQALDAADMAGCEFYTLQGIRVDKPVKGQILIVRRGATATKQVMR